MAAVAKRGMSAIKHDVLTWQSAALLDAAVLATPIK